MAAAVSVSVTQDAVETLSLPTPDARVSQAVVETLSATAAAPATGTGAVTISHPLVDGAGTVVSGTGSGDVTISHPLLAGAGTVAPPPIATRTTQQAVDVFEAQPARTRATQTAVEVFHPTIVPVRATQAPVELFDARPATLRVSQEPVEVFLVPRPRRLIRRLRRAPHVHDEHRRIAYAKFALDLQRGVGALMGQGANPVVTLRLSRDGGRTWGEPVRMRAGTLGAYTTRVLARRLGHARDAVFEVTVSDPVAWSLVQAWLDLEPGTS